MTIHARRHHSNIDGAGSEQAILKFEITCRNSHPEWLALIHSQHNEDTINQLYAPSSVK
jgi:hypothetical protein